MENGKEITDIDFIDSINSAIEELEQENNITFTVEQKNEIVQIVDTFLLEVKYRATGNIIVQFRDNFLINFDYHKLVRYITTKKNYYKVFNEFFNFCDIDFKVSGKFYICNKCDKLYDTDDKSFYDKTRKILCHKCFAENRLKNLN